MGGLGAAATASATCTGTPPSPECVTEWRYRVGSEKLFLIHHLAAARVLPVGVDPNVIVFAAGCDATKKPVDCAEDEGGGLSTMTTQELQRQYRPGDITKEEVAARDAAVKVERVQQQARRGGDGGPRRPRRRRRGGGARRPRRRRGGGGGRGGGRQSRRRGGAGAAAGAGAGDSATSTSGGGHINISSNHRSRLAYNPPDVREALKLLSKETWKTSSPSALARYIQAELKQWDVLARHYACRHRVQMKKHLKARRRRALHRVANQLAPSSLHVLAYGTGFNGYTRTPKGRRYSCVNRGVRHFLTCHRRVIDSSEFFTSARCPRYVGVLINVW